MTAAIAVALFLAHPGAVLLGLGVSLGLAAFARLAPAYIARRDNLARQRELAEAETAWRATEQNRAYLAGDPYGIYGEHQPTTQPIFDEPREWYDVR